MIPPTATFRRAEGLWFTVAPCRGLDEVLVVARRQGDDVHTVLTRGQVRLLTRLSTWRTAAELGVAHAELALLVDAHVAFWSRDRPSQDLTGAPLDALDGAVALRGNVHARPLIAQGGQLGTFPHLPRLGELDDVPLAGLRLEVVEWETVVATISFACCRAHAAALRDLVPRLDGRARVDQLDRELIAVLDDLGLLERHAPPAWDGRAQVTWLGHAGILYEAHGRRILIDPPGFPRSEPTRYAVRPFDLRDLGDLDAVLITHGDTDHLDPTALVRIPRTTPIVIPRDDVPQPFHVDLRRVLELLGFERVITVATWERVPLGDVTVIAAPYIGEDWGLGGLPCRTYAITGPDLTIYANADSITDDDACDRLAAELSIDLAFVGIGGAAESHAMPHGYGYGHFYLPWIPAERHDEWILLCNGPREAAAAARRLGARFAFGYAAGGVPFYQLGYTDRGTHAELAALLADGPVRPLALEVGVAIVSPRCRAASTPAPATGAPPSR